MFVNVSIFVVGLILLYSGAEFLVRGSSRLAKLFRLSPLVIGLTVVAFGTSAPELLVSAIAALREKADIALGNIVGSNIANIGLILGASAIVSSIKCQVKTIKREVPIMIGASFLLLGLSLDGMISFLDGLILFSGIVSFIAYSYWSGRKESESLPKNVQREFIERIRRADRKIFRSAFLTVGGIALLVISAHFIVDSAVAIAGSLGVSHKVIALSMVAFGTSLPELATSMVAVLRNEPDISIGNIIGSCIFNIFCVLGVISIFDPIAVKHTFIWDYVVMLLFSFLLIPIMLSQSMVSRSEGVALLALYGVYITLLALRIW